MIILQFDLLVLSIEPNSKTYFDVIEEEMHVSHVEDHLFHPEAKVNHSLRVLYPKKYILEYFLFQFIIIELLNNN
jgi:hypothetical protein